MNINQLEYFICVAECLNFTKAAAKCYISQTAMTQQIKALEKKVGVPLFVRDKHHVQLTNAGKVLLSEARTIVEKSDEAMRLARLASDGVRGQLTIGYIRGYGSVGFSSILRNFHSTYPGIQITLVRDNLSGLLGRVDKGECDIVFAVAPQKYQNADLNHLFLQSYPVMGVLQKEHPLGDREYLTYSDLEGEKFIMMQPADRAKDQMEESVLIYERGGYLPNVVAVERDPESLLMMISAGLGISIVPEYVIHNQYRNEELKILPMLKSDKTAETVDFHASWSKHSTNSAVERLVEMLKM